MLLSRPAILPAPVGEHVVWEDAFSAVELSAIEEHADGLMAGSAVSACRVSIARSPQSDWLYQRLEEMVLDINAQFFRYELYGLAAGLDYDIHRDGGGLDWCNGRDPACKEPRKLSLILQLSDGQAYQGGDVELHEEQVQTAPRRRGTLIAFPSYVLRRVTPVVAGIRKSLTIRATGPEFR